MQRLASGSLSSIWRPYEPLVAEEEVDAAGGTSSGSPATICYKQHGETLRVRWDYAFFQMLLETNYYLSYKTAAAAGATSTRSRTISPASALGVPGDSFPDVSSGVRAHLEHLLLYSGEEVRQSRRPTAPERSRSGAC